LQPPTAPSRIVLLVAAALFINYIDRGNLATAAPLMKDELHLSASQLGVLLSAFYYTYVVAMAPAGWLAERYGAHIVFSVGVAIWSVATFLTGFASSFVALLALRLLLGLGESVGFPCASKLLAQSVVPGRLGLANGVMSFGYLLGPAVGTLIGGLLMAAFGWRPVFIVFGAISLGWLWPWRKVVVGPAPDGMAPTGAAPSFRQILHQRALWGAAVGLFSANYSFYFILAWLPFYLVKARGFSVQTMAVIASWAYLLNAVGALAAGWLTDRWLHSGRSADLIYKSVMAANHVSGIACMVAMIVLPVDGAIIALFVYEIVAGVASPGLYAIPQIIAGPTAAGRWVGIHNGVGALAGILAPAMTGLLVDRTGQFATSFALAAAVSIIGLIAWLVVLPRIVPLRWAELSE
jgi:MFS family permease